MRLLLITLGFALVAAAQSGLSYKVVMGWPSLPAEMKFETVTGVALDPAGKVWVLHRSKDKPLLCFDPASGKLLDSWGGGLFGSPHGLSIDREGNFWITDTEYHQVFRFNRDHKLTLTLGEKGVPGADARHFDKPTATAIAPNGDLYVADGYGNTRVAKFTSSGKFLKEWGTKGDQPGQFSCPG
jgi:DNA-binding beta-propeller fold protein YncE